MTPHDHIEPVPGCYRCEISADEARERLAEIRTRAARRLIGSPSAAQAREDTRTLLDALDATLVRLAVIDAELREKRRCITTAAALCEAAQSNDHDPGALVSAEVIKYALDPATYVYTSGSARAEVYRVRERLFSGEPRSL